MATQLTFRLAAEECISTLGISGWSCNFLLPVSPPNISSVTLTNDFSPLCDTRICIVQQEPLHFYRANCADDHEHRYWHRNDILLALSIPPLTHP